MTWVWSRNLVVRAGVTLVHAETTDILEALLTGGIDPNRQDNEGRTGA